MPDVPSRLAEWQSSGDERLFKLIISPEFGDRLDLEKLTREVMDDVQREVGTHVEWIGVAHFNTGHPHVHVALRGIDAGGHPIRLNRDYIKHGIRRAAENACTRQLGYRTELDAMEAERREVPAQRFTSLDRTISRRGLECEQSGHGEMDPSYFMFELPTLRPADSERRIAQSRFIAARLATLESMGLAEPGGPGMWQVRRDFENVLLAMQKITDRQKTLAARGVAVSDHRLPVVMTAVRDITTLEGRVLLHGEDEIGRDAGRGYMMLEGTDARIHCISYTPELEDARSKGAMRPNSYVRLRGTFSKDGRPVLEVNDSGDANRLLRNKSHFREAAQKTLWNGCNLSDSEWGGWLGKYHATLGKTIAGLRDAPPRDRIKTKERER